jgi:RNA-directed DNA polymerase
MQSYLNPQATLSAARVASNRGARTAGVDGMTVGRIRAKRGERRFLEGLRVELRSGVYRPSSSRRILVPKASTTES